jgi:hypothetical protein
MDRQEHKTEMFRYIPLLHVYMKDNVFHLLCLLVLYGAKAVFIHRQYSLKE